MVEVFKASFFPDIFFELMDGAGGLDGIDTATLGADEVVAVDAWEKEHEVGGAFVKAEAANHAFFSQALEESEDRCLITGLGKMAAGGELTECHRAITGAEAGEKGFERFGAAESGGFRLF